jgi:hypothetical protein
MAGSGPVKVKKPGRAGTFKSMDVDLLGPGSSHLRHLWNVIKAKYTRSARGAVTLQASCEADVDEEGSLILEVVAMLYFRAEVSVAAAI